MSITKYVQIAQNLSPHKGTAFGGITDGRCRHCDKTIYIGDNKDQDK
tara:strand:- start:233 stop:373 length:141 start_codon:yes stop_codon:yes gene_type:complete